MIFTRQTKIILQYQKLFLRIFDLIDIFPEYNLVLNDIFALTLECCVTIYLPLQLSRSDSQGAELLAPTKRR